MSRIISIANQKGGVGKTTTATALAYGLKKREKKVLLIDTDPQCNSSDTYRAKIEGQTTLYDVMCNKEPIEEAIQHASIGDILPSDPLLSQADSVLVKTGKEHILKKAIAEVNSLYDYIIIDTPPTLGILLLNALTASDTVIIPIGADRYSLQGLSQFEETINAIKEFTNPNLTLAGFIFVKHNNRTNLSKDIESNMPEIAFKMGTNLFRSTVRESVAAREAQALQENLIKYAPQSTTAQDYMMFVDEIIEKGI